MESNIGTFKMHVFSILAVLYYVTKLDYGLILSYIL